MKNTNTALRWKIDEAADLPLAVIEDTADGFGICELGQRTPRNLANAHLIGAAPDLLEACQWAEKRLARALERDEQNAGLANDLAHIRAAIAKATPATVKQYQAQAARDAQRTGYGSPSYWDTLEAHALELRARYLAKGDTVTADQMLSRSLSEALQGNEGA